VPVTSPQPRHKIMSWQSWRRTDAMKSLFMHPGHISPAERLSCMMMISSP
jgi:hypothetical protein